MEFSFSTECNFKSAWSDVCCFVYWVKKKTFSFWSYLFLVFFSSSGQFGKQTKMSGINVDTSELATGIGIANNKSLPQSPSSMVSSESETQSISDEQSTTTRRVELLYFFLILNFWHAPFYRFIRFIECQIQLCQVLCVLVYKQRRVCCITSINNEFPLVFNESNCDINFCAFFNLF